MTSGQRCRSCCCLDWGSSPYSWGPLGNMKLWTENLCRQRQNAVGLSAKDPATPYGFAFLQRAAQRACSRAAGRFSTRADAQHWIDSQPSNIKCFWPRNVRGVFRDPQLTFSFDPSCTGPGSDVNCGWVAWVAEDEVEHQDQKHQLLYWSSFINKYSFCHNLWRRNAIGMEFQKLRVVWQSVLPKPHTSCVLTNSLARTRVKSPTPRPWRSRYEILGGTLWIIYETGPGSKLIYNARGNEFSQLTICWSSFGSRTASCPETCTLVSSIDSRKKG